MNTEAQLLAARLLTHRALPRTDSLVRKALVDEGFREALDAQLAVVGLCLLDNPQAAYVAVGLLPKLSSRLFGDEHWNAENLGLDRHAAATLVVVWALLILPKRERQARLGRTQPAAKDLFGVQTQIVVPVVEAESLGTDAFVAEYRQSLGAATNIRQSLGVLARLGFIEQRNKRIYEGPLLDLAVDYATVAPRILDGALRQVLPMLGDVAADATPRPTAELDTEDGS